MSVAKNSRRIVVHRQDEVVVHGQDRRRRDKAKSRNSQGHPFYGREVYRDQQVDGRHLR